MMGSLFLKGPEIDLTDLPKIVSRYFCIFGTLEFLKTQKYRRIHENRTEIHSDVHYNPVLILRLTLHTTR